MKKLIDQEPKKLKISNFNQSKIDQALIKRGKEFWTQSSQFQLVKWDFQSDEQYKF